MAVLVGRANKPRWASAVSSSARRYEVVMRNSVIAKLSSEVRMQVEISIEYLSLLAFAKGKQGLYDYDSVKSNINSVEDL